MYLQVDYCIFPDAGNLFSSAQECICARVNASCGRAVFQRVPLEFLPAGRTTNPVFSWFLFISVIYRSENVRGSIVKANIGLNPRCGSANVRERITYSRISIWAAGNPQGLKKTRIKLVSVRSLQQCDSFLIKPPSLLHSCRMEPLATVQRVVVYVSAEAPDATKSASALQGQSILTLFHQSVMTAHISSLLAAGTDSETRRVCSERGA